MSIIPAIDLLDNKVVRLERGKYHKYTVYDENPLKMIHKFLDAQIKRIHIVDLAGSRDGKLYHENLIKLIKENTDMAIQFGGGIRSFEVVKNLFQNILNKKTDFVLIGSLPFKNRNEFKKIIRWYRSNVILTVDVWDEDIRISGWTESAKVSIFDFIEEMSRKYKLNYFLVTQIKKDGLLEGLDLPLYKKLEQKFPNIHFIASGGVSNVMDIQQVTSISNVTDIILGKAYYEKRVTIDDLQKENLL